MVRTALLALPGAHPAAGDSQLISMVTQFRHYRMMASVHEMRHVWDRLLIVADRKCMAVEEAVTHLGEDTVPRVAATDHEGACEGRHPGGLGMEGACDQCQAQVPCQVLVPAGLHHPVTTMTFMLKAPHRAASLLRTGLEAYLPQLARSHLCR
jgi:hypothetical protein